MAARRANLDATTVALARGHRSVTYVGRVRDNCKEKPGCDVDLPSLAPRPQLPSAKPILISNKPNTYETASMDMLSSCSADGDNDANSRPGKTRKAQPRSCR